MALTVAVGAVLATSATAAVETGAAKFYTGEEAPETVTELAGSQAVTAKLGEHPVIGTKATARTVINGLPIEIAATGIECVGCKIQNKEVTSKAGKIAYGEGKIRFTGVTPTEPESCTVSGENGEVEEFMTKQLLIHGDWMDSNKANSRAFIQVRPASGGTIFAQFKLGGTCSSLSAWVTVTGSLFGESKNNTGVSEQTQGVVFSPAVQETSGAKLLVGAIPLSFTATFNFETPVAGKEFFTIK